MIHARQRSFANITPPPWGRFGIRHGEIDTLVLGCTHYPFAAGILRSILGPQVQLIDTGQAVACQTKRLVHAASEDMGCQQISFGEVVLHDTGRGEKLQAAAARWLQLSLPVETLRL